MIVYKNIPKYDMSKFIYDDDGYAWYFRDRKIRMVLAEVECQTKEEREDNGYYCENLQDGIRVLKEFGYITEEGR